MLSVALVLGIGGCDPYLSREVNIGSDFKPVLRAVDGGPDYYGRFTVSLPTDPEYFPVGVWLESVMDSFDVEKDQANGINTYVNLTEQSNQSKLNGMGTQILLDREYAGRAGAVISDEADMWGGPGDAEWTGLRPWEGSVCTPSGKACGYTIMQKLSEPSRLQGILRYANYGKGVTFWEVDSEAGRFVNNYQDVVSADNYWFTDPNICFVSEGGTLLPQPRELSQSECRRAANYGWTVDKMRGLVEPRGSKPVWAFVEVGHPSTEDYAPTITGAQASAAVWSSIIHGARGIIYFNHSFGGGCYSHHVLRDSCGDEVRPLIAETNRRIHELAPVLNAPFVDGALGIPSGVDASVKLFDNHLYIIAGATEEGEQRVPFRLNCSTDTTVDVMFEQRSLVISDGTFTDTFADGNATHIYRISGDKCQLPA